MYGEPADQRPVESHAPSAQEEIREASREEEMDDERPGQRDVGGKKRAKQERRIEDVAVHRGDVRQTAEEIRIPLWNPWPALSDAAANSRTGKPPMNWSLRGLTRNPPASAGYARANVHSAYTRAAHKPACRGSSSDGRAAFAAADDFIA
jgi:hypothetical protein